LNIPQLHEPAAAEGTEEFDLDSLDKDWMPEPTFLGADGAKFLVHMALLDRHHGKLYVMYNNTYKVRNPLNLRQFPFDSQQLEMVIEYTNAIPVKVVPWDGTLLCQKFFKTGSMLSSAETRQTEDVTIMYGGDSWEPLDVEMKISSQQSNVITLNLLIERKHNFYLWNVLCPKFLLGLINSTVVGIDPEDLADRLSITVTLLLTLIAFRFVLLSGMPKVSYVTLMDWYMVICFAWLCMSCLESFLAKTVLTVSTDHWVNGILAGLWILLHAIVLVCSECHLFRSHSTIEQANGGSDKSVGSELYRLKHTVCKVE